MIVALLFAGIGVPVAVAPAGASTTARRSAVPGYYTVWVKWSGMRGWATWTLRLKAHGTGNTEDGTPVGWSLSNRTIAFEWTGQGIDGPVTVDYIGGRKNARGFSRRAHPATMSTSKGDSGIWYAVKIT
jgi:hypothetical protein